MLSSLGFPSPAQGYEAEGIDFNSLLIKNKPASFCMRMRGLSLSPKGIMEGDILVVDRSVSPIPGRLVVFQAEGEFFCRELIKNKEGLFFHMEKDDVIFANRVIFFGVVTAVVRKL